MEQNQGYANRDRVLMHAIMSAIIGQNNMALHGPNSTAFMPRHRTRGGSTKTKYRQFGGSPNVHAKLLGATDSNERRRGLDGTLRSRTAEALS